MVCPACLNASRVYLANSDRPSVGYLPAAALDAAFFLEETRSCFSEVAAVELLDPVSMDRESILRMVDHISLLYVPGGNTFVLSHRLQQASLMAEIAQRVRNGLPLVGFSAGAVLCGMDILNSNDRNACGCRDFAGLGLVPFSLNVHYAFGDAQPERDERIAAYHAFHSVPVLALEDDAHLRVEDARIDLCRGRGLALRWFGDSHDVSRHVIAVLFERLVGRAVDSVGEDTDYPTLLSLPVRLA